MTSSQSASFRIRLHGAPLASSNSAAGSPEASGTEQRNTFAAGPLGGGFDQWVQRLESLPRAHVELDGSFVLRSDTPGLQIDGMIYDALGQVQHVELIATSDRQLWNRLLSCLLDPSQSMPWVCDLMDGTFCPLDEFERNVFSDRDAC